MFQQLPLRFSSPRRNLKEAVAQYLLANGIAVVVANTRLFDGWNIDLASWKTGEDPVRPPSGRQPSLDPNMMSLTCLLAQPFFEALGKAMSSGKLGPINPKR